MDLLREPAKDHVEEKGHAMALDQSALLELLEALKLADVDDRIRAASETLYQAFPSCAPARSSRLCPSGAGGSTRRCSPW